MTALHLESHDAIMSGTLLVRDNGKLVPLERLVELLDAGDDVQEIAYTWGISEETMQLIRQIRRMLWRGRGPREA